MLSISPNMRMKENPARIRGICSKCIVFIPFLWFAYTVAVFLSLKNPLLEMSKLKVPYRCFHKKTSCCYVFKTFKYRYDRKSCPGRSQQVQSAHYILLHKSISRDFLSGGISLSAVEYLQRTP